MLFTGRQCKEIWWVSGWNTACESGLQSWPSVIWLGEIFFFIYFLAFPPGCRVTELYLMLFVHHSGALLPFTVGFVCRRAHTVFADFGISFWFKTPCPSCQHGAASSFQTWVMTFWSFLTGSARWKNRAKSKHFYAAITPISLQNRFFYYPDHFIYSFIIVYGHLNSSFDFFPLFTWILNWWERLGFELSTRMKACGEPQKTFAIFVIWSYPWEFLKTDWKALSAGLSRTLETRALTLLHSSTALLWSTTSDHQNFIPQQQLKEV